MYLRRTAAEKKRVRHFGHCWWLTRKITRPGLFRSSRGINAGSFVHLAVSSVASSRQARSESSARSAYPPTWKRTIMGCKATEPRSQPKPASDSDKEDSGSRTRQTGLRRWRAGSLVLAPRNRIKQKLRVAILYPCPVEGRAGTDDCSFVRPCT